MNRKARTAGRTSLMILSLLFVGTVVADFDIDWYTIDGGGEMFSTGNSFELSGTIGQPDAGLTLTGGTFELTGGFWKPAWRAPERRVMTPDARDPLDQDYEEVEEQPLPPP